MSLFDAKLGDVTEADLQALVDGQVAESRVLEYKRDRIGSSQSERQEFLADVTSFANAAGGHLILGVEEAKGIPISILGFDCDDPDSERLRLEQIVRTGTRPAVQGMQTGQVKLASGRIVLVMRIPRSWNGPHQVGQTGSFRFIGRGSNGKYQLDVDELRQLFSQGPEIAERLRQFRINRILAVESGAIPVELEGASLIVMHFVPIDNFGSGTPVDARPIALNRDHVASLLEHGGRTRTNVDGWIARSGFSSGRTRSYVQLYRNGTLESVTYWEPWGVEGMVFLPGTAFDEDVHRILQSLQQLYGAIGVTGPVAAMVSLIGMKGWRMGAGLRHRLSERHFDRTPLLCPEVVLDSLDGDAVPLARPLLDLAWNAAGFDQSMNYDQSGKWNPIRS